MTLERLAGDPSRDPLDPLDIDQASFILYTSGTTGRAKGVLLSVRGMLWVDFPFGIVQSPGCGPKILSDALPQGIVFDK